jgi:four helix bundle protein
MEKKKFIPLKELKVYQLARQLSTKAWLIYSKMNFEDKKNIGDQFIRSVDSVGANIAEGYFRFYYLDKCRFYYNSRASLAEAMEHWLELLLEREKISKALFDELSIINKDLQVRLNNFIKETKDENNKEQK